MGFILADLRDLHAIFHNFFLFFFLAEKAKAKDLKHLLASVVKDPVEYFFFFFPVQFDEMHAERDTRFQGKKVAVAFKVVVLIAASLCVCVCVDGGGGN